MVAGLTLRCCARYSRKNRARAYAILAESMATSRPDSKRLFNQARTMAREETDQECLSWILADIATRRAAASSNPATLLKHALALATTIPSANIRAETLTKIAVVATNSRGDPGPILLQALASAKDVTLPFMQLEILARMTELASKAGVNLQPFLAQALAAAESSPEPGEKAPMLANIACHFVARGGSDPLPMFRRALRAAAAMRHRPCTGHCPWDNSSILATIVEGMAHAMTTRPNLLRPTIALARRIPSPEARADALTAVAVQRLAAGTKPQEDLREALAIVDEISCPALRGKALAVVAAQIGQSHENSEPILGRALAAAESVPPRHVWTALAGMLDVLTRCGAVALSVFQGLLTRRQPTAWDSAKSQALATIAMQVAGAPGSHCRNLRRAPGRSWAS